MKPQTTRISTGQDKLRKSPSQARSKALVEAIVVAAARILSADGIDGLNTNRIAEKAGVSVGSLYQYFPNKESILVAVVEYQLGRDEEVFSEVMAKFFGQPAREAIVGMVLAACQHQQTLAPLLTQLLPLLSKLNSEMLVHRAMERHQQAFATFLKSRRAELRIGLRDDERIDDATFVIIHALRGVLNATAANEPERLGRSDFGRMVALLTDGLFCQCSAPSFEVALGSS